MRRWVQTATLSDNPDAPGNIRIPGFWEPGIFERGEFQPEEPGPLLS